MRTRQKIKKWTSFLNLYRIWNNGTKNYQFFHSHNSTFIKEKHLKTIGLLKSIISPSKISKYNKTIVHKYHKVKAGCLISSFLCTQIMRKKKRCLILISVRLEKPRLILKFGFKKKFTSFLFLEAKKLPHSGNLD